MPNFIPTEMDTRHIIRVSLEDSRDRGLLYKGVWVSTDDIPSRNLDLSSCNLGLPRDLVEFTIDLVFQFIFIADKDNKTSLSRPPRECNKLKTEPRYLELKGVIKAVKLCYLDLPGNVRNRPDSQKAVVVQQTFSQIGPTIV